MDELLEKAIKVAEIVSKKDPNQKAKELFIRIFKNDRFRADCIEWLKNPTNEYPSPRLILEEWQYDFLKPAVREFLETGAVKDWPIFGCRLTDIPMDGFEEPAIVIGPEASQKDVIRFIKKHWSEIKKIANTDPFPRLGKIRPEKKHDVKSLIYSLHLSGLSDSEILTTLFNQGKQLKGSENPIVYVRKTIERQRKIAKKR